MQTLDKSPLKNIINSYNNLSVLAKIFLTICLHAEKKNFIFLCRCRQTLTQQKSNNRIFISCHKTDLLKL